MAVQLVIALALTVVGLASFYAAWRTGSPGFYFIAMALFLGVGGLLQVQGIEKVDYTSFDSVTGQIQEHYTALTSATSLEIFLWSWLCIGMGIVSILNAIRELRNEDV